MKNTLYFVGVIVFFASLVAISSFEVFAYQEKGGQEIMINTNDSLTAEEVELLIYGQQEERLARDVYQALYQQYGEKVFLNIAKSEDRHVNAIGNLLDAYGVDQTIGYGDLDSLYDALLEKGMNSLEDALNVGVDIEMLDISDIDSVLLSTDNKNIQRVYSNLRKGSINHLKSFVRNLQQNGYSVDQNWTVYINQDEVDSLNGKGSRKGERGKGKRFE